MTFNDKQLAMANANFTSRYIKGIRELPLLYNFVGDGSGLTAAGSADAEIGGPTIPTDIANLLSWVDASDPTKLYTTSAFSTNVSSDGDPVGGWERSGGSFNCSQPTGSARPVYKTNIINGLSVIRFDNVNDYLNYGTVFGRPASYTILCVLVRSTLLGRRQAYGSADSDGEGNDWGWLMSDSSNIPARPRFSVQESGRVASRWQTDDDHFVSDVPLLVTQRYVDGNTIGNCKINGVDAPVTASGSFSDANSGTARTYTLGRRGNHDAKYWRGDIAEWMLYDAALSDGDIADLEATLIEKWAI